MITNDFRRAVKVPLEKVRKSAETIGNVSLWSFVEKILAGILVERVRWKHGECKSDRGCVNKIFTLKQISEKYERKIESCT